MLSHHQDVEEFVQGMQLARNSKTKAAPSSACASLSVHSHPRWRGTGKDQLCLTDRRMLEKAALGSHS